MSAAHAISRYRACIFGLFLSLATGNAQQSLFQSSNGDTSIFLAGQNGVALVNFGASKATLGYVHDLSGPNAWGYGIDFTGTAQGGTVSLIKDGVPQTGIGGDFSLNKQRVFWKPPPLQIGRAHV